LGTTANELAQAESVPGFPRRQPPSKLILLLLSLVICLFLFLALDWLWTAWVLRAKAPTGPEIICFTRDAVRHHALEPNCSCKRQWGKKSYPFATNSLGFRDENIRQVPLTGTRPRILLLGDSFTEGMVPWPESYVGQIAARFPQYEFLNGAVESDSPSNYFNVARALLDCGVKFDEVIVFIDMSDAQDEAAFYRDIDASGAVDGSTQIVHNSGWYATLRLYITEHLLLTNRVVGILERESVKHGFYRLNVGHGPLFDLERSAWTYRKVSDKDPYEIGYAPLGVEGGLVREQAKMDLLWRELEKRNIPLSVVVYPWPAQIAHDTIDSKQVRIWRDWCAGKCKRFVSLFPAFFAVKEQCPKSEPGCWYLSHFIFGDTHYNSTGDALAADVIIRSLAEEPPTKRPLRVSGPDSAKEAKGPARSSGRADDRSKEPSNVPLKAKYSCRCGNVIPIVPPKLNSVCSGGFGKRIATVSVMPVNSVKEICHGFLQDHRSAFWNRGRAVFILLE